MNQDEYLERLIKNFSKDCEWSEIEEKESLEIIMKLVNLDLEDINEKEVVSIIKTVNND